MKSQVNYNDFAKLDLRIGEIAEAEEVEGSEKLLKLTVNFGPEIGKKTVFSGIKKWYNSSSLTGRKLIFIINLSPKKFKIGGTEYESQGMMVAAGEGDCTLYSFDKDLPPGTLVH